MKRNEDDGERFITFSERKSGIYKKAIELHVTLCGDGIGILVFSSAGKPSIMAIRPLNPLQIGACAIGVCLDVYMRLRLELLLRPCLQQILLKQLIHLQVTGMNTSEMKMTIREMATFL
ncbi:hypothetical protein POUND7_003013 [Theobroma cacao]